MGLRMLLVCMLTALQSACATSEYNDPDYNYCFVVQCHETNAQIGRHVDANWQDFAADLSWPLLGKINSPFGLRKGRMHEGIDIDGNLGDDVRSAALGIVKLAERTNGYGRTVVLSHGDYTTLYAHLNSIDVAEGDLIERGEIIGNVGKSGHATGPHLHFEVRDSEKRALDPVNFLEQQTVASIPGFIRLEYLEASNQKN